MSLPDSPLIAGTGGQYALIQRISASLVATPSIAASAAGVGASSGIIKLPIVTGQGVQIRDASVSFGDDDGTGKLSVAGGTLVLLGPGSGQPIAFRGQGASSFQLVAPLGNNTAGFGFSDWPFIAWNDFPQFGSSLAPNLRLLANVAVSNSDAGAAHLLDMTLCVVFEIWQGFTGAGHVGY